MSINVEASESAQSRVAVVGAGSIGVAFAVVFSRAGCQVRIFDPDSNSLEKCLSAVELILQDLNSFNLLEEPVIQILARIKICGHLAEAVADVEYVQECAPEKLNLKRDLFAQLDKLAGQNAIFASASSAIPMSQIADGLRGADRCLVTHPGNPPFLIPVIEVVPSPITSVETVERAIKIMTECALDPILINQEIEGFVFNRLQGALLREAYCLVRDGIASVDDVSIKLSVMDWGCGGRSWGRLKRLISILREALDRMLKSWDRLTREWGRSEVKMTPGRQTS